MLAGLDDIPWATLGHAYGEASDVPDQIRALASDDAVVRERAAGSLWNNINHQGTVYEATPHAVPFLIELAAEPTVRDRASLLYGMAWDARGWSFGDGSWTEGDVRHPSLFGDDEVEASHGLAGELADVRALRRAQLTGVPTFVRLLADPDPEVRAASSYLLSRLPEAIDATLGPLKGRVELEADARARACAILAVGFLLGTTASGIDRDRVAEVAFADGPPIVRLAAALALIRMTPGEVPQDVLDFLALALGPAREEFAALPWCEREPVDQIGAILESRPGARLDFQVRLLDHDDARVRSGAIASIESICRERRSVRGPSAVALAGRLADGDVAVREAAATALGHLGRSARAVLPRLAEALDDPSPTVGVAAGVAMGKLGDERAVPALIEGLGSARPMSGVIEAIAALGPAASAAVPGLIRLVADPPRDGRSILGNWQAHAAVALGRVGEAATVAIPSLIAAVRRGEVEYGACAAFRALGPAARPALPEIESLMDGPDQSLRMAAATAHAAVSGDPERAVDLLMSMIRDDPHPNHAFDALAEIGEPARAALPLIEGLLRSGQDRNEWARFHAARALWRVDRRADVALPILLELFESLGSYMSGQIADTLAEMGPLAREAIPRLRAALGRDELPGSGVFSGMIIEQDDAYLARVEAALARIGGGV